MIATKVDFDDPVIASLDNPEAEEVPVINEDDNREEESNVCITEAVLPVGDVDNIPVVTGVKVDVVNAEETIPAKVNWHREDRAQHMRGCFESGVGVLFAIAYLCWLGSGIYLVSSAEKPYEEVEENGQTYWLVSDHYREDMQECCDSISYVEGDSILSGCDRLYPSSTSLVQPSYRNQGIFHAYLYGAPEVPSTISITMAFVAMLWLVLLHYFSRPIVYATEVVKACVGFWIGGLIISAGGGAESIIFFLIGVGILAFAIWRRENLVFAAKMINLSTVAMKKNNQLFLGAVVMELLYVIHAFLFVWFFIESFESYRVEKDSLFTPSYCSLENNTNGGMVFFVCFAYLWISLFFDKVRLSVIAYTVGSWYFHPDDQPSVWLAMKNSLTSSFGTLSTASVISSIADQINRSANKSLWVHAFCCFTGCCFYCVYAIIMVSFKECVKSLSKFAVIVHTFSGLPFCESGAKSLKILKRHFANGFVTEYSSRSVIWLGAYVFSIGTFLFAWWWLDEALNTNTGPAHVANAGAIFWISFILFLIFNMWYPVLAMYVVILLNRFLAMYSDDDKEEWEDWVTVLGAIFIGLFSMLFFTFVGDIVLDVIDVLFISYSVNKDNGELVKADGDKDRIAIAILVQEVPDYLPVAQPVGQFVDAENNAAANE